MKKVIKNKIILGIIIIIAVSIVGIKMATKEEMNIKGVNYENGEVVETDLGKYNKNKKYEGYEAYILSDNSNYNIFKNDKVEVKYPKNLNLLITNNGETDFSSKDSKVYMFIMYSQHIDKNITTKEIIEKRKKFMDENKKALNFSNIEFNAKGNKIFEIDTGENNKYGGFSETIINGKDIYEVSIFHTGIEVKNWDEITKNIKESFKVL